MTGALGYVAELQVEQERDHGNKNGIWKKNKNSLYLHTHKMSLEDNPQQVFCSDAFNSEIPNKFSFFQQLKKPSPLAGNGGFEPILGGGIILYNTFILLLQKCKN